VGAELGPLLRVGFGTAIAGERVQTTTGKRGGIDIPAEDQVTRTTQSTIQYSFGLGTTVKFGPVGLDVDVLFTSPTMTTSGEDKSPKSGDRYHIKIPVKFSFGL